MSTRAWLAKMMTFAGWMAIAEVIDALRVFPRAMLAGYCIWAWYICDRLLQFFFDLPSADKQSAATATFCGGVIGVVTLIGTKVFQIYSDSGRDWVQYHQGRAK